MIEDKAIPFPGAARGSQVERQALLKSVAEMSNLPTPSPSVMQALLLLRSDEVKLDLLVKSIERDQSLVAQALKIVNSGFYGLRSAVDSVERAVTLIGLSNVKRMIFSAAIMDFFSEDEQVEWSHSYSSSLLASSIIVESELYGMGMLPLSMIMHDIGKVVLRRFSPRKYSFIIQNAASHKMPIHKVEEAVLHINHADVGAMLLTKWDFADEIVKPVLLHHSEGVPSERIVETAIAQYSNWIDCSVRGIAAAEPSIELMDAAGLLSLDRNYWMNYQSNLIDSLEFSLFSKATEPRASSLKREESPLIDESAKAAPAKAKLPPLTPLESELVMADEKSRLLRRPIFSAPSSAPAPAVIKLQPEKAATSTQVIRRGSIVKP